MQYLFMKKPLKHSDLQPEHGQVLMWIHPQIQLLE